MDVIAHGFAKVCKADKVKAVKSGKLKFSEAAIKILFQFPVGSSADQGDVHGNKIAGKGSVPACFDCC